jgi:hypothetical protein
MSRRLIYLVSVVVALILIQFIRPEKNLGEPDTETDFIRISQVPDTLTSIILNSCYDCHSNHTHYPWYSNVAPFSWYLNKHIEDGKAMPLKSYLLIHRSSRLSEQDIHAICEWTESEALKIMTGE